MKAYRIALTPFCDASGEGAKLYGGRWNLQGTPAIYTGASISACLLERLTIDSEILSSERYLLYSVMEFEIPDHLIFYPGETELPRDWNKIPAAKPSMEYGTNLLNSGITCFGVPSVVDPSSLNFVINPNSKDFHLIESKTYPLTLDKRILR
ncbi:RES family NAD+ phosphorylase [Algoriphagus confluentis]|uniref:RES family NAD+ phosphorylase n=1 Tax=Algoriphagus confluentis TaxID=1697556 RepID=A0ABQ6PRI2_9BACT|nr:RES family NAD+ phosphorylase [Algoriphagus confluentis]